jgi:hypothetical protein
MWVVEGLEGRGLAVVFGWRVVLDLEVVGVGVVVEVVVVLVVVAAGAVVASSGPVPQAASSARREASRTGVRRRERMLPQRSKCW